MDRFAELLEVGKVPWHPVQPAPSNWFPRNVFTRRRYDGASALALLMASQRMAFASPYWGSMCEWETLGGRIPGHQVGSVILPGGRRGPYEVYNLEQVAGSFPASSSAPAVSADAGRLLAATGADIRYNDENEAVYYSRHDYIVMPYASRFHNMDGFYLTAFHELSHRSEARVGWCDGRAEVHELRADMAADFVMAEVGRPPVGAFYRANIDDYAAAWGKMARNTPDLILETAVAAARAVDHLLSYVGASEPRHGDRGAEYAA